MRYTFCGVFLLASLLLSSCTSQRPIMVPETQPAVDAEVSGWMSLSDGTFHSDQEGLTPQGYHVKGIRKSWETFHPKSGVLGTEAPIPESAKKRPGWLELDDGSIHPIEEAIVPRPPYLRGYIDDTGRFYPDPLDIVK